ncbi:MAG: N-acetylmuramic acid 6-phosphate etherase [Phycisphaerae bacterium]|jgi:N-acetylmuramic acid 6-phosphate etherase|nr:N-acetylmuramic acid 6-phosphate etherase [Phycisphaerae bacterium]
MKDRSKLTTEQRNPRSRGVDSLSSIEIVDVINAEDALVAGAVGKERKAIAAAVDLITDRFRQGGRLFYVGAGTSGRLGVLDASECPPTFGSSPSMVQGIIAGGRRALVRSAEGAEDFDSDGADAVNAREISELDTLVGIAASGLTPYVIGALKQAKRLGAATVMLSCNPNIKLPVKVDVTINPVVGPEVVTGSTRMKAGTATKLVLNTLTTAAMIRLGKVYDNLMVDLRASCEKLRDRSERIVMELTGLTRKKSARLLAEAKGGVKVAIVMHFRRVTRTAAARILKEADDSLREAIREGTDK